MRRALDHRVTLQKLEVFCAVAELGSMTQAAAQLFTSQPVVTAHVRDLEARLGVTLIRREGRGIALTDAGRRVLKWAQGIMTRTAELERELAGTGGEGRPMALVAASMSAGSYLLPPLVCDFYEKRPDGLVQIVISTPQAALDAVRGGGCDFAVVMLLPDQNLSGLIARPLWNEALILVSAPSSRWVGDSVDRETLATRPFVSTYSTVMRRLEDGQLSANGIPSRHIVAELGHPEAQKEAIRRDIGIGFFLWSSVQRELSSGDLRQVETPGLALRIPLYIVRREDKELSPYQMALKDFIASARPRWVTAFDQAADGDATGAASLTGSPMLTP